MQKGLKVRNEQEKDLIKSRVTKKLGKKKMKTERLKLDRIKTEARANKDKLNAIEFFLESDADPSAILAMIKARLLQ